MHTGAIRVLRPPVYTQVMQRFRVVYHGISNRSHNRTLN